MSRNRLKSYLDPIRSRLSAWIGDAALARVAKNASLLMTAQVLATLISMVRYPMVTRLLGPENYGVWSIASGWVGVVAQILSFRLWETVIKYFSQFMEHNDEARALALLKLVLMIDLGIGVLSFVAISLSADMAASFVLHSRPDGADLIRLEALNMLMGISMSVWMAVLRVFDRFRAISIYNVLSSVALFIFWAVALLTGAGLAGLILATAIVKAGQTTALAILAHRDLRRRFRGSWLLADLSRLRADRRAIGIMLFSMNLDTFRKMVTENGDVLILSWFAAPLHVGLYKLSKQLAFYINQMFGLFYDAMYPEIPRLYATGGPQQVRVFIRRSTFGLGLAATASVVVSFVLAPPLVPVIFGPEYAPAIPLFLIQVFSSFWVLLFWAPPLLVTLGKVPQLVAINYAISTITLIALLVLTPFWYAYGAAFAFVANLIAALMIYTLYFARVPGFEWRRIFLNA